MEAFEQLMIDLKALSINKSMQGMRFERLMKQFFLTDRLYCELYDAVWMWNEFPYNGGKHDSGIDLVVKSKGVQEYCAIQCKFYDPNNSVSKEDVDTFLSASGKTFYADGVPMRFAERLIVSTTDKWTSTAEDTIKGQVPPVNRLRLQDLRDSSINWTSFTLDNPEKMQRSIIKSLYTHQRDALDDVIKGFSTANRGKLIMACGTGKTFTSLRIAEALTNGKGKVLFLVPSISLLNQSLTEWTAQCKYDYHVYAICSDPKASQTSDSIIDTAIPATTNVAKLTTQYHLNAGEEGLQLFFSTYQSIDVIAGFQQKSGIEFDLIICDEAHRTTGVTLANDDESSFVKVHNDDFIHAKRRLYMTATPRIYGDESKEKADTQSAVLCSMDDEAVYGKEFHRLGFSEAVALGLLSDYKVLVLAVDENYVNRTLQKMITDDDCALQLDDAVKIVGCLNGLSKKTIIEGDEDGFESDPTPMKRAVAFSSRISDSKKFVEMFRAIQDEYKLNGYDDRVVSVELDHVDGKQSSLFRKDRIDWLKADTDEGQCRVLSNARCLSEGIDVPALDAVMFLNPRHSTVDIVQSVGRVMRKTDGKKYGYIILPIGIPAGMEPEDALADNEKYKIVWDVLQALRAHDDRFNNTINKIELNKAKPKNISIIGVTGRDGEDGGEGNEGLGEAQAVQLSMNFTDLQNWKNCIYAKIVKKCGSRQYWETWAKDIAEIASRHIAEIHVLLENKEIAARFEKFIEGLRENLNPSISEDDAIEMLAEHMITKPVFDALFDNYDFIKSNPVSLIMQEMLDTLHEKALEKEQETLDKFYASVKERAKGLDNAEARQKVIIELYERFFKNALPKQVAKLGIVYTPIEVVDFIIKSVDEVLRQKFSCSLSDKNVHVLDPFTGTGTFIVRLLRSGLIKPDDLLYKYTSELHANEIVLLAYYIAAINIEETFHELYGKEEYKPFEGIVLTDTFELTESATDENYNAIDRGSVFEQNSARARKQLETPIRVIIGNPPYSVGQKSGNDDNQNVSYPHLDASIAKSYAAKSKATLTRNVYDTYIKAFRWATDRIGENGVIGFVSNGAYLDGVALDGFRQCLLEDFNSIYCFNLRGNARTNGERRRKEAGNIFDAGSRTPVAITILVKKKGIRKDGYVHYCDIGDYLNRAQKLDTIRDFGSIAGIHWEELKPDVNADWLNKRNPDFVNLMAIGDKKKKETESLWNDNYAIGLSTSRDVWVYSFNQKQLNSRMIGFIDFYNAEMERCHGLANGKEREDLIQALLQLRSNDPTKINWSRGLFGLFSRNTQLQKNASIRQVMMRPFCKEHLYYNRQVIEMPSRWEKCFPSEEYSNFVICISGAPLKKPFSVFMTDCIQDLHLLENAQSYPLYFYDSIEQSSAQMTISELMQDSSAQTEKYRKRYAISDASLTKYRKLYGNKVQKEDIFYYVYAVLHSKEYITRYADNLNKELPRIPTLDHFAEYLRIGKALAQIHLNYEQPADVKALGLTVAMNKEDYSVEKMRFAKEGKTLKKDTIFYNSHITISNIPQRAYEYIINGQSAIEWIMEKYQVAVDKDSGIRNDPNDYAGGKYIFDLLISIISMSLKTLDLTDELPEYKEI